MNNHELEEFVRNNPVGVVSTSGSSGIASAAVYYVLDTDGVLYFNTRHDTEKLKNIRENPEVSFAVFQRNPDMTLQYKGTAEVVSSVSHITDTYTNLLQRIFQEGVVPPILRTDAGEVELVKVTPTWVRFGNFSHGHDQGDTFITIIGEK